MAITTVFNYIKLNYLSPAVSKAIYSTFAALFLLIRKLILF